jgi:hypothetical protein
VAHLEAPIDDIMLFNELLRQLSSLLWGANDNEIPETLGSKVGREDTLHMHLAILCNLKEGLDNAGAQSDFLEFIVANESGISLNREAPLVEAILQRDL